MMNYQYFEKHPDAQSMSEMIEEITNDADTAYFHDALFALQYHLYGIQVINDDDLSNIAIRVDEKYDFIVNFDATWERFEIEGFDNDDWDSHLSDIVYALRAAVAQIEKTAAPRIEIDSDNEAGDYDDGINDVGMMKAGVIQGARYDLLLTVRHQLRLYPYVCINDNRDEVNVEEDDEDEDNEKGEILKADVMSEKDYIEEADYFGELMMSDVVDLSPYAERYEAFDVPIKYFGDKFTLCFSPHKITVQKDGHILPIPPATEIHVILNEMLEVLSDRAKPVAREWRKQQVFARLERNSVKNPVR